MTSKERDEVTLLLLEMVNTYPTAGMKARTRLLRELYERQAAEIERLTTLLNKVEREQ